MTLVRALQNCVVDGGYRKAGEVFRIRAGTKLYTWLERVKESPSVVVPTPQGPRYPDWLGGGAQPPLDGVAPVKPRPKVAEADEPAEAAGEVEPPAPPAGAPQRPAGPPRPGGPR